MKPVSSQTIFARQYAARSNYGSKWPGVTVLARLHVTCGVAATVLNYFTLGSKL